MNANILPSELSGVVAVIDPDAYAPGAVNSGWFKVDKFWAYLALILAGDLGTDGTLAAKFQQATTSGGAGAKDITGKAVTLLTEAGTDANKQALINLRPEELDIANDFAYARLVMTGGDTSSPVSASSDWGGVVLGFYPRNGPASDYDLATVDEIVR